MLRADVILMSQYASNPEQKTTIFIGQTRLDKVWVVGNTIAYVSKDKAFHVDVPRACRMIKEVQSDGSVATE